jgi:hydroxymethylpyrimidine pyrophosphatase-like HAD family hydrolase
MKTRLILTLFLSLSLFCTGNNLSKILPVLKQVETNGNVKAIGDNGKAFGVLQIHKICVDDVNRIYGTEYTHEDAFNEACAEEIFMLYINAGVKRFKLKYGKNPTEKDIVRMWNGGFYNGYKKQTTLKYYKRYLRFKKLIRLTNYYGEF